MVQQFQFESCPFQWAISYRKVLVPIDDRVGTGLGTGNLNWMDAEERGFSQFSPNAAPLLTRTHPPEIFYGYGWQTWGNCVLSRDFPGPRCTGGPVAERRDGSGRGPGGAPRDSMSFRMSHIEAKSINIWLRYDP